MVESPTPTSGPAKLCGYAVVETLKPGETHLAIGPGGRGVVLKKLDPDCLYRGLLHPDVRDRLSRVRELAHTGVANFFGVGKDADDAWLIWEYVEGKSFADFARAECPTQRHLAVLVREVVLTLESLHLQGIVHGSIASANVIVVPGGAVRLTHVSPLLYADPADDVESLEAMVSAVLAERHESDGGLGHVLAETRETKLPLRTLAVRMAELSDERASPPAPAARRAREERRVRKRAVFAAVMVAMLGCAGAYGAWRFAGEPGREHLPSWLK